MPQLNDDNRRLLWNYVNDAYGMNLNDTELNSLNVQMPELFPMLQQSLATSSNTAAKNTFNVETMPPGLKPTSSPFGEPIIRRGNRQPGRVSSFESQVGDVGYTTTQAHGAKPSVGREGFLGGVGDFLGGTLWGALDTASFGVLNYLETKYADNAIERFALGGVAGEDELSFWAKAGQGIGTVAGFAVPMGAARTIAGAGVKFAAKSGTRRTAAAFSEKQIAKLTKKGVSQSEAEALIKPFADDILSIGSKVPHTSIKRSSWSNPNFVTDFQTKISTQTRAKINATIKKIADDGNKIKLNKAEIDGLERSIHEVLGVTKINGANVMTGRLPIHSLESALSRKWGSSQLGARLTSAVEEGTIFAGVESILELSHSYTHDTDYNAWAPVRGMALGGALGGIVKFVKGGQGMRILPTAGTRFYDAISKRNPWAKFDIAKQTGRIDLGIKASSVIRSNKGREFLQQWTGKNGKQLKLKGDDGNEYLVRTTEDLLKLVKTKKGAAQLQEAMGDASKYLRKEWWPDFWKASKQDISESMKRMFIGGMVFQAPGIITGDVVHENKEDWLFNFALGAVLSKNGKALKWRDSSGIVKVAPGYEKPYVYSKEFQDLDNVLNALGAPSHSTFWQYMTNESQAKANFFSPESTVDMKKIRDYLSDAGVLVPNSDKTTRKNRKTKSDVDYENYEMLQHFADMYPHLFKEGDKRILTVDEATSSQIKSVMKLLKEESFEGTVANRGLESVADIHDIMWHGGSKNLSEALKMYQTSILKAHDEIIGNSSIKGKARLASEMEGNTLVISDLQPVINSLGAKSRTYDKYLSAVDLLSKAGLIRIRRHQSHRATVEGKDMDIMEKYFGEFKENLNDMVFNDMAPGEWKNIDKRHHIEGVGDEFLHYSLMTMSFRQNVNHTRKLLQDLKNNNQSWEGIPSNASLESMFRNIFYDNGRLVSTIEIQGNSTGKRHRLETWTNNVLSALGADPSNATSFASSAFLANKTRENKKAPTPREVEALRTIFRRNGLNGFDIGKSMEDAQMFLQSLSNLTRDHTVANFKIFNKDGNPVGLNSNQRQQVMTLLNSGMVDKNFNIVHITEMVNKFEEADLLEYDLSSGSRTPIGVRPGNDFNKFMDNNVWGREIKSLAERTSNEPAEILREIFTTYNQIIEPMKIKTNNNGEVIGGFLKDGGAEGTITPHHLQNLVIQLRAVKDFDMRATHNEFMDKLEVLSHDGNLNRSEKLLYEHLFSSYLGSPHNSGRAMHLMAKMGLYDKVENKFAIDMENDPVKWKRQISEFIKNSKYLIPLTGERALIRDRIMKNMKDYKHESDDFNIMTTSDYVRDYKLDFLDKNLISTTPTEYLHEIFTDSNVKHNPQMFFNKLRDVAKIRHDGKEYSFSDNKLPVDKKVKFIFDTQKMYNNLAVNKAIPKLRVNTKGNHDVDIQNTMRNNTLFESLDQAFGDFNIGDFKLNGNIDTRVRPEDYGKLADLFASEDLYEPWNLRMQGTTRESTMPGETTYIPTANPGYLMRFGDLNYPIHVPKTQVDRFALNYSKFVNRLKTQHEYMFDKEGKVLPKYKSLVKNLETTLEKFVNIENIKKEATEGNTPLGEVAREHKTDGDVISWDMATFKLETMKNDVIGQSLETMFQDMWLAKKLGKEWMDKRALDADKKLEYDDVAKILSRHRLLANTSMTKMNKSMVKGLIENIKTLPELNDVRETLKRIQKDGFTINLVKDEVGKLIPDQFSVHKSITKDIDNAKKEATEFDIDDGDISTGKYHGKEDSSTYDSVTIVSPKAWDALKAMSGVYHIDGLGGIKPIVLKTADSGDRTGVLIGKTVFVKDKKWDNYFSENGADMLMVGSAAKLVSSNMKTIDASKFDNIEALMGHKHEKYQGIKLGVDELSLGSIVRPEKDAAIPYHTAMEYSRDMSTEFYNWLHGTNIETYINSATGIFNAKNFDRAWEEAIKMKSREGFGTSEVMDKYILWIESGNTPLASPFLESFKNEIKNEYLDKTGVFSPKNEYGRQSVMVPDASLRNTIFHYTKDGSGNRDKREYFSFGEIDVSDKVRMAAIDKRYGLEVIKHHKNKPDEVVKMEDLVGKKAYSKLKSVGDAHDALQKLNTEGISHYIKLDGHRTPSTRISDNITVALRGFRKGNQVSLNAHDVAMRVEGDYDVDKLNYWWNTPESIGKHNRDNAGRVPAVPAQPTAKKVSATKGQYSLGNAESRHKYNTDTAQAAKMRGTVQKMRSTLEFLRNYSSFDDIQGMGFGMRMGKQGGRIGVDLEKLKQVQDKLAQDVQWIFDSSRGYDSNYFNSEWKNGVLFGGIEGHQGIFTRFRRNEKNEWVKAEGDVGDSRVRGIVTEVIRPYETFLQLRTETYKNGVAKSVRYNDLVDGARLFERQMKNLSNNIYFKLSTRHRSDTEYTKNLKRIFIDTGKVSEGFDVFGSFGANASLDLNKGNAEKTLLPYDRVIAKILHKDRMSIDAPERLFEGKLDEFDATYDMMILKDTDLALQSIVRGMQKDGKNYGFLNYLAYKKSRHYKAMSGAKRANNDFAIEAINEKINEIHDMETKIREQMSGSEEVMKTFIQVKGNQYITDIKQGDWRNAHVIYEKAEVPRFQNKAEALAWINNKDNQSKIMKYAASRVKDGKAFDFVGINSFEQANMIAFGSELELAKRLEIDANNPQFAGLSQEYEGHIVEFRKTFRKKLYDYYNIKDHSTEGRYNDVEKIYNEAHRDLTDMYDYYENVSQGLGRVMVLKIMAPKMSNTKITYFGFGDKAKMMPAFKDHSMSMINMGISWIAKTNRLHTAEKKEIFSSIGSGVTNTLKTFYGQPSERGKWADNVEKLARGNQMIDAPLIGNYTKPMDADWMKELNPELEAVFPYSESHTINWFMLNEPYDFRVLSKMKANAWYDYLPVAQIRSDYAGGPHPSISVNNQLGRIRDKATMLLGQAATNKILRVNNVPSTKHIGHDILHDARVNTWEGIHERGESKYGCKEGG